VCVRALYCVISKKKKNHQVNRENPDITTLIRKKTIYAIGFYDDLIQQINSKFGIINFKIVVLFMS